MSRDMLDGQDGITILSGTIRTPWLRGVPYRSQRRDANHIDLVYPCGCVTGCIEQDDGRRMHETPVDFTTCAVHSPLLASVEEYRGQIQISEAETIAAIITHLRATRPELVHFAGAMHRDLAARRVIEEYLLTPSASEDDLRERAARWSSPANYSAPTLAEQWGGFAAVHLRTERHAGDGGEVRCGDLLHDHCHATGTQTGSSTCGVQRRLCGGCSRLVDDERGIANADGCGEVLERSTEQPGARQDV